MSPRIVHRRARRFCVYCGQVIEAKSRACLRHAYLLARDPHYGAVEDESVTELAAAPVSLRSPGWAGNVPQMHAGPQAEDAQTPRERGA